MESSDLLQQGGLLIVVMEVAKLLFIYMYIYMCVYMCICVYRGGVESSDLLQQGS